jgi:hypothetical protein
MTITVPLLSLGMSGSWLADGTYVQPDLVAEMTVNVVLGTVALASFGLVTIQVPVLLVVQDAEPPVLHVPVTRMPLALPSAAVWARIVTVADQFLPEMAFVASRSPMWKGLGGEVAGVADRLFEAGPGPTPFVAMTVNE